MSFSLPRVTLFIPWVEIGPWHLNLPWIGDLPIHAFSILVAVGVLVGARVADWKTKKDGLSLYHTSDMVFHIVVVSFICAHVLDVIMYHPERIKEDPLVLFRIWQGLSSYGGFIGGIIGWYVWHRRSGQPFLVYGDIAAFGLPFGWFFGRLGCFTAHDHPGKVSSFFLAVRDYRVGAWPWEPRHDLGLYEAIWSFGVCVLFLYLAKTPRRAPGFYLAWLAMLYAPIRFGLDFLRMLPEDAPGRGDVRYLTLTPGQWWSIVFLGVGIALYLRVRSGATAIKNPYPNPLLEEKGKADKDLVDSNTK